MTTYLVTGGCGFIGSHIAEALVEQEQTVIIYDDLSSGYERNIAGFRDKITFIEADIRDVRALTNAMQGVDYVFHEAALVSVFDSVERPVDNHDINITGTLNVLVAARECGVKRVVVASSAAVYGDDPALPKTEEMIPCPESPYALAKIVNEHYMRVFANLFGLEAVVLRYFNVYGPRQDPGSMYSGVIAKFSDDILAGRNPTVFGDGLQTRDFIFVRDVVEANLLAMNNRGLGKGEVFNIATGRRTSLLDLLNVLKDLVGKNVNPQIKDARRGDVRHSVADITRAQRELGFTPRYGLREGLGELLEISEGR
ncbi:MAG: SDR family oxidoreductase [Desulfobacterales bacterium]